MGKVNDFLRRNDLDMKVKRGKISYEDALLQIAKEFAGCASSFWDSRMLVDDFANRYNRCVEGTQLAINNLVTNTSVSPSVDKFIIQSQKEYIEDIIYVYNSCNAVELMPGYIWRDGLDKVAKAANKELDMKGFLNMCLLPEVKAYVLETYPSFNFPDFYPTISQFMMFNRYTELYGKMERGEIETCFNKFGQIINEDGDVAEPNPIAKMVPIDYKGL